MRLLLLIAASWAQMAWAFPELIRHGYAQCTACHVSPSGGGVLNQYGRQLSAEVLSTWSYENEEQFLHSKVGKTLGEKGILFGGDIRGIQTHEKDPNQEQNKTFLMMADIEGAYQTGAFTGVLAIGEITKVGDGGIHGNFYSPEYYGLLKITDEIGVRAGRFLPAYGINFPDHTLVIKEMFGGVVPKFQFDTVEASYLGEHWTVLATAARSNLATQIKKQEYVNTANVSYNFMNSMRVGASYWAGTGPNISRRFFGPNAILGITSRFYNMTELDYETQSAHDGLYGLTQFGYEVCKGLTPYIQYQRQHDNVSDLTTLTERYGAGAHFYPRPHWELSGEWDRVKTSKLWADSAYVLAHYYF